MSACQGCGKPLRPSRGGSPRKWCSESCRKHTLYSGVCIDCGSVTYNASVPPPKRCRDCDKRVRGPRSRAAFADYKALVERLWATGMTSREIGAALGWTTKNHSTYISALRGAHGYELPHRRTPEQLARMAVGADERMAKAREVYRQMKAAA